MKRSHQDDDQVDKQSKPKVAKKAAVAFSRQEDMEIINWFKNHKDTTALMQILPGRGRTSVEARVKVLFQRWEKAVDG